MKSFLTFSKWTKINVQNRVAENVLTEKKNRYDIKKLSSQTKPINIFCYHNFFHFFRKKLKDIFTMEINGNFRKRAKRAKRATRLFLCSL